MIDFLLSFVQSVFSLTNLYWFQLLFFIYLGVASICLLNYLIWGRS